MPESGKTQIVLYHSETASATPNPATLAVGELAVNIPDKKIYTKNSSSQIVTVGSGTGIEGSTGSTDNQILRADGTGGKTAQATGITVTDTNTVYGDGTEIATETASYTLVLSDAGKTIEMNVATGNTLTIPANSSVAFPVGTIINLLQYGAGQTTVAITTDTLRSSGSKTKLTGQYSGATLIKRAATEWYLVGDITT